MIRSIFALSLLVFAIFHSTLTAAAYIHHRSPNPNIYHFDHLLPRQDISDGDTAATAAPSSLPTNLAVLAAASSSPSATSPSPTAQSTDDSSAASFNPLPTTTPPNEQIFPLDPTSASAQSSLQTGPSSPSPNSSAAATSDLNQSDTSTTMMANATAAPSSVQAASFQLGSDSSMGTNVATAPSAGATGLDVEPGSDMMSSGVGKAGVLDGRFWGMLMASLGVALFGLWLG